MTDRNVDAEIQARMKARRQSLSVTLPIDCLTDLEWVARTQFAGKKSQAVETLLNTAMAQYLSKNTGGERSDDPPD